MRDLTQFIYSFVLEPPLSADEIASFRESEDPWQVLAYLVHRASDGDFSQMPRIESLLRNSSHALFWGAATKFVGMAGTWSLIERVADGFREASEGIQQYIASMLLFSCNPAFAERLVALYEAAGEDETRQAISWSLSFLLEPERGLILMGAKESDKYGEDLDDEAGPMPDFATMSVKELFSKKRDYEGYRETIRAALARVRESGAGEGDAVLEGAVLDARGLVMRIADRLKPGEDNRDRVVEELVVLSAMTGADVSHLLKQSGGINGLDACALVESLLDDPGLNAMSPGRRYFFGHPITE